MSGSDLIGSLVFSANPASGVGPRAQQPQARSAEDKVSECPPKETG